MKRKCNRSRYVVYIEPWEPGRHKVVYSKWQAKKILWKGSSGPGSEIQKCRLIWENEFGRCSWWNVDRDYDFWTKL